MTILVRDSLEADIDSIQAIYAHHVLTGTASFELDPPDRAEMARRRADVLANGFPYLVAVRGEQILGYAYANYFRTRPAYRFSVENSIYVREGLRRQGVGRALLTALVTRCEANGVRQILAVIGDSATPDPSGCMPPADFALRACCAPAAGSLTAG